MADEATTPNSIDGGPQAGVSNGKLSFVKMSEVKLEQVDYLWPPFIALGNITAIAGRPGVGKSQATIDMAARVTTGMPFPSGQAEGSRGRVKKREPGSVILISCEDDAGSVVLPRLLAAGADVDRVHLLQGRERERPDGTKIFDPVSLSELADEVSDKMTELGDVKLIIVDPIGTYTGSANTDKDSEVRAALAPLSMLAKAHKCAVLLVMHLNKGPNKQGADPVDRILGSVGYVGLARSVLMVTRDPGYADDNSSERLLLHVKANGEMGRGFEFRLEGVKVQKVQDGNTVQVSSSRAVWGKQRSKTATSAMN